MITRNQSVVVARNHKRFNRAVVTRGSAGEFLSIEGDIQYVQVSFSMSTKELNTKRCCCEKRFVLFIKATEEGWMNGGTKGR